MVFETERFILREWREDDAEDLYGYARDPRVGPITGWVTHTDIEDSRKVLKDILMKPETYAIVWKETNRIIGSIGIMFKDQSDLVTNDKECEIGFWLGVPYWGRGIMPEAVNAILIHIFDNLNMDKVWCGYFDGNTQSRRVQEKCGFKYCFTSENVLWKPLNEIKTIHNFSITSKEWREKVI